MSHEQMKCDAIVRREVELYHPDIVGVVIECETGVWWTVQAGCVGCLHPGVQGIFVPLNASWIGLCRGPDCPHENFCADPDELHRRFEQHQRDWGHGVWRGTGIVLDRSRWGDAHEAWIPVRIEQPGEWSPFQHFGGHVGWLHYPNCD